MKAAAVVAEVVTVVAETENGVAETVLTLREVSIVVAEATTTTTTEDLEKIKMGSLLRAKSPTVEVAEVVATLTEIEAAEVVTEVVIAATIEVAATEEAEIVPKKRAYQLSNNKTLSELDRAVNSLSSDEMKITNLEGVHSFQRSLLRVRLPAIEEESCWGNSNSSHSGDLFY